MKDFPFICFASLDGRMGYAAALREMLDGQSDGVLSNTQDWVRDRLMITEGLIAREELESTVAEERQDGLAAAVMREMAAPSRLAEPVPQAAAPAPEPTVMPQASKEVAADPGPSAASSPFLKPRAPLKRTVAVPEIRARGAISEEERAIARRMVLQEDKGAVAIEEELGWPLAEAQRFAAQVREEHKASVA